MASNASPRSDHHAPDPAADPEKRTAPEGRSDVSEGERAPAETHRTLLVRRLGLAVGLVAALLVYLVMPADVPHAAKLTAATAVLMAVWWMTEALPIPATALVPLVVFPVLNPGVGFDDVGASYGNNIIFLFMGGFMLALAMQRWNLHKRIALAIVGAIGTSPSLLILGFMIATGFISMWVSNTATAVMMLPIGVSVLVLVNRLRLEDAARRGEEPGEGVDPDLEAEGYAMARAGTPPSAIPSSRRSASSSGKLGDQAAASASTVAAITARIMAGRRPRRSPTTDHGITASASPAVAAETVSAACSGPMPRSAEISCRIPCGEYSWAKQAMPAQTSASCIRR